MLEKFGEMRDEAAREHEALVASFDDEVARKTEWGPLKGGGRSYASHALKEIDRDRVEFRATAGALAFAGVFVLLGLFLSWQVYSGLTVPLDRIFEVGAGWGLVAGLFFAVSGLIMLYVTSRPIVFDKREGMFWKGRKPSHLPGADAEDDVARLGRIHAIQILEERVRGSKKSYSSYELNLVRADGTRVNVVDHGKLADVRRDAAKLADFLGVPVWDAS